MTLGLLISLVVVAFAGALSHEIAHWIVWQLSGRNPQLDLWKLEVRPRAGPQQTVRADRVAAVAPYVLGAGIAVLGWYSGALLAVVFGAAMHQIPSAADVRALRGKAVWRLSQ